MWIKICGIREIETARQVAAAGVDAIGLNFYSGSPRSVSIDVAAGIVTALPAGVTPIGLFVNHSLQEVFEISRSCGLRTLQLHGNETPEYLAELQGFDLIRAFRIEQGDFAQVDRYLADCKALGVNLWGCLIDAHVRGSFGGTGKTADWEALAQHTKTGWPRMILAGGLSPSNIAQAVARVHPWGVDTASGVESSVGIKEISRVRAFVQAARPNTGV